MRSGKVKNGIKGGVCNYYSCSTYSSYGVLNEFGCQCNTTRKEFMEEVLAAYLEEARQKLAFDNRLENLPQDYEFASLKKLSESSKIKITVKDNFKRYIREQLGEIVLQSGVSLSAAYKAADQDREASDDIIGQIKVKQDEFEKVYQHSKYLTDYAKDRANEEMNVISKDIRLLRSRLAPQDRCMKIDREISNLERRIDAAISATKMNNCRTKAEAAGKVIEKIICKFDYITAENKHLVTGTFGAKKRRTVLAEIQIVPVGMEMELFKIKKNDKIEVDITSS